MVAKKFAKSNRAFGGFPAESIRGTDYLAVPHISSRQ